MSIVECRSLIFMMKLTQRHIRVINDNSIEGVSFEPRQWIQMCQRNILKIL